MEVFTQLLLEEIQEKTRYYVNQQAKIQSDEAKIQLDH